MRCASTSGLPELFQGAAERSERNPPQGLRRSTHSEPSIESGAAAGAERGVVEAYQIFPSFTPFHMTCRTSRERSSAFSPSGSTLKYRRDRPPRSAVGFENQEDT